MRDDDWAVNALLLACERAAFFVKGKSAREGEVAERPCTRSIDLTGDAPPVALPGSPVSEKEMRRAPKLCPI